MSSRTEYQHPTFSPFSDGRWMEVVLAWTTAATVLAVFLATAS